MVHDPPLLDKCNYHLCQRSSLLRQMKTQTENQNWTQGRDHRIIGSPDPPGYADVTVLLSMASGDFSEKDRKTIRVRILGSLM